MEKVMLNKLQQGKLDMIRSRVKALAAVLMVDNKGLTDPTSQQCDKFSLEVLTDPTSYPEIGSDLASLFAHAGSDVRFLLGLVDRALEKAPVSRPSMVNNGRFFIRRTRGDYWGAQAMEAILNTTPFASIPHVMWGDREDRGEREFIIFIWVNAPADTEVRGFCDAQLNIIDAALEQIPSFKSSGEFPNK